MNENIGLTAVHAIFHSEHNRLVAAHQDVVLATNDLAFLSEWLVAGTAPATFPATPAEIDALQWNGERLFQSAKFGTEMQYQHLVFEEFARTIQPQVDAFLDFDDTIDPSIVAEFAHTVYRFGHSMLTETIDRLDPEFRQYERDRPDRGVPQSAGVCRQRSDPGGGGRRHRARHDPPGSATRSTSSSPRRCATTCSACRSTSPRSTSRAAATPGFRRSTRRAASSTKEPATASSGPIRAGPISCST